VPAVAAPILIWMLAWFNLRSAFFRASNIAIDDGRKNQAALMTETWKNHDRTDRSSADRYAFQLFVLGQAAR